MGKGFEPCGAVYLGIDVLRHVCARKLDHTGGHFPWPDPDNGRRDDPMPVCAACRKDVTEEMDGAFGFVKVGERWFHIGHEPSVLDAAREEAGLD